MAEGGVPEVVEDFAWKVNQLPNEMIVFELASNGIAIDPSSSKRRAAWVKLKSENSEEGYSNSQPVAGNLLECSKHIKRWHNDISKYCANDDFVSSLSACFDEMDKRIYGTETNSYLEEAEVNRVSELKIEMRKLRTELESAYVEFCGKQQELRFSTNIPKGPERNEARIEQWNMESPSPTDLINSGKASNITNTEKIVELIKELTKLGVNVNSDETGICISAESKKLSDLPVTSAGSPKQSKKRDKHRVNPFARSSHPTADESDSNSDKSHSDSQSHSSHRKTSNTRQMFYRDHSPQIWRWNVTFSGDYGSLSASEFVRQINDLAYSRRVSNKDLLISACELFTGTALKWYRAANANTKFKNWDVLTGEL